MLINFYHHLVLQQNATHNARKIHRRWKSSHLMYLRLAHSFQSRKHRLRNGRKRLSPARNVRNFSPWLRLKMLKVSLKCARKLKCEKTDFTLDTHSKSKGSMPFIMRQIHYQFHGAPLPPPSAFQSSWNSSTISYRWETFTLQGIFQL